ncbi:MAG: hypothetical protein LBC53_05075 [Spirochaetaceae bacterium]|nr:hypothetical protein [Spirochaetaceae bacterium]
MKKNLKCLVTVFAAAALFFSCKTVEINMRGSYQLPVDYEEANSWRNGKIDPFVHAIIESPEFSGYRGRDPFEYIQLVGFHIKSNSKNDFERVKRAHDFVIDYLTFDVKSYRASVRGFFPKSPKQQDALSVVRTGIALGEGYVNLFKALCDAMDLQNEIVKGYARGVFFNPLAKKESITQKKGAHQWLIVQIDECWYIVDVFWDAGYVVGTKSLFFENKYSTEYLFVNPQQFVYTHFPYNMNQQLMEYLIQPEDFVQLPFQRPAYFEQVVQMIPNFIKEYEVPNSVLSMSYLLTEGIELDFLIYDKTGKKDLGKNQKFFEKKQTKRNSTQFYFNKKDSYILRIYYRASHYSGSEYIAECGLIVR